MTRRRDRFSHPIHEWSQRTVVQRNGRSLAPRGEKWYTVSRGEWLYTFVTRPWSGTWCVSARHVHGDPLQPEWVTPVPLEDMKVRKLASAAGDAPRPRLPSETAYFKKVPLVVEFVCATNYDDGSSRTPGYMTFRNRGHAFELTLYDPDSGLRLVIGGPDIDHCYMAANTLLGAEQAPWVCDDYLTSQLTKKRKK